MTLSEIKKELKKMATTNLPKALKKYEEVLTSDSYRFNEIILQQGSYNSLKNDKLRGVINDSRATQRENQIRHSIISMVDMLEDEDVDLTAATTALKKANHKPPVVEEGNNNTPPNPPVPSGNSSIYISYAWNGKNEETADLEKIVNLLDKELEERGIKIIRDKRDLGYRGSIKAFMEDIGKGNKVIVIISKKYLQSPNCMFELTQIYENKDFANRIFPIVLSNANIYSPLGRIEYLKFWEAKIKELEAALGSLGSGMNTIELRKELDEYGKIRTLFSDMAFIIKDMNTLSPEIHHDEDFQTLYDHLAGS